MTRISGDGKQDWGTPRDFLRVVERRFGRMDFDLAANPGNTIVKKKFFTQEDDALGRPWRGIGKNLWLNPPFKQTGRFAKKCSEEAENLMRGQRIFLLVRASVGSNWYRDYVHGYAEVYALNPRLRFQGAADDYNGDIILAVFRPRRRQPGFFTWDWDDPAAEPRSASGDNDV